MQNAERAEILRRRYSPRQILDLMGRFEFAVGMRLHFLIFAALRGTPFAALPYASKVTGCSKTWRWRRRRSGASASGSSSRESIARGIRETEIRATIERRLPVLERARARETNDLLLAHLRERGFVTAADVRGR